MAKRRLRDLVVLLPGMLGSVLQKDGQELWAPSVAAAAGALNPFGPGLRKITLEGDDPDVDDLGDGIRATRLFPDPLLVAGLLKIDGYSALIRLIFDRFEVERGEIQDQRPANFIEFPYDWRRDNRVAARQLKALVDRQLPLWREHSGARDAKVILLAHSMGGLVARHYLECRGGWENCRALITFGTPYRGSLASLDYLAHGYRLLFRDVTEVVRTFTSIYQVLPIYPVVLYNGVYQRVAQTDGIPGVERARAAQGLAFHDEIMTAVEGHLQDAAYWNVGYKTLPVVGTRQRTLQSAELVGGRLRVGYDLPALDLDASLSDGDGTVPRISAVPFELAERLRDVYFPERHGALQRNAEVLAWLEDRLEQIEVMKGLAHVRGPEFAPEAAEGAAIALEVEDLYLAGEPVELRVHLLNVPVGAPDYTPQARIEPVDRQGVAGTTFEQFRVEGDHAGWFLRVPYLSPGMYRVTVTTTPGGPLAPPPVHDLFAIAG